MTAFVPVVLCGGSGTRFWPLSTDVRPKQFLKIWAGGDSLFQITMRRLSGDGAAPPVIICNTLHEDIVRTQLDEIGLGGGIILLEPERRDSAAAIAAAAAWVHRHHGPDVPLGVFPSDQLIRDDAAFRLALASATELAAAGYLVTFGITPDRPATEFGYIERANGVDGFAGAFRVGSFHEKPNLETAETYLASGRFDWNSGMFVFTAASFLCEAGTHMPGILDAAKAAVVLALPAHRTGSFVLDRDAFTAAEKTSIDYALFERAASVVTVPLSCGWSDLGNWQAAHTELERDDLGNATMGDVKIKDASNNIIISDHVPVRVMGVDGLAIVVSAEGVLVTRIEDAVRLKDVL